MPYSEVSWAARDPVIYTKLQQMADNESYLKTEVDDHMPKGILAAARRFTGITGLVPGPPGAGTILSGLTQTVTLAADRITKVSFFATGWSSNQDDTVIISRIYIDGAKSAGNCQYIAKLGILMCGGEVSYVNNFDAGTYDFQAGIEVVTAPTPGTVEVSLEADSENPCYILVEDLGSANGLIIADTT